VTSPLHQGKSATEAKEKIVKGKDLSALTTGGPSKFVLAALRKYYSHICKPLRAKYARLAL